MSLPQRGEVWWCELPDVGRRPVVVLSRTAAVKARRQAVVAPCTTTLRALDSEVHLDPATDPVPRRCSVSLDSLESAPVALLTERLGSLSGARMRDVCAALAVAVDCSSPNAHGPALTSRPTMAEVLDRIATRESVETDGSDVRAVIETDRR